MDRILVSTLLFGILLSAGIYYIKKRLRTRRRITVLRDFGKRAEEYPWHAIYDVSCLPHPKKEILDALYAAIIAGEMGDWENRTMKNAVGNLLTRCLPRYQEGVGKEPLYPTGDDLVWLREYDEIETAEGKEQFMKAHLETILKESAEVRERRQANANRYKQMEVVVERESAEYFKVLATLPSNSAERASYIRVAEQLRSHNHDTEKWLEFLPAERRTDFEQALRWIKDRDSGISKESTGERSNRPKN